jgi:hypothetical protein
LIRAGGETLLSAIHKLVNSIWNKEELPDQWKYSIIVPIHKKGTDQLLITFSEFAKTVENMGVQ